MNKDEYISLKNFETFSLEMPNSDVLSYSFYSLSWPNCMTSCRQSASYRIV